MNSGYKSTKRSTIPVVRQLALLGTILLLLLGTAITPKLAAVFASAPAEDAAHAAESAPTASSSAPESGEPFADIQLRAKAAYVWDVNNQKALYKKDEAKQLPLASITKLMTALIAHEVLDDSSKVTIDSLSVRQDGDSGLREGEVFSRLSLTDLTLMSSSNDGAFALAAAVGNVLKEGSGATAFVNAMNVRAKELGLHETFYKNPTGLDISPQEAGAYGSARDMAFLMEYILKNDPDILTYTTENGARVYSESGAAHDAENTNYYVDKIPGLIGSKTGFTDLAGGNLIVAFDAGLDRPIIAVVLGSTQQERFTDVLKLVKESQAYVRLYGN
jgi:D-alanyl-D-alanine carboxypeptidase